MTHCHYDACVMSVGNSDRITSTMAQALLGGRGGSELPPHGQDNRAELTRTRTLSSTR
jgi:hypothetical protein